MNMYQIMTCIRRIAYFLVTFVFFGNLHLSAADKTIVLEKSTASVLPLDGDIAEIFIANPDIADVQQNSPKLGYIYGKKAGVTTIFATDSKGKVTTIDLTVTQNLSEFNKLLNSLFPSEQVIATSSPSGIILTGSVSTAAISKDVETLANQYIDDTEKVINNMSVSSPTQILLKVKIAELNRSVINRLGFNWLVNETPRHFMFGLIPQNNPLNGVGRFRLPGDLTPPSYAGYGFQFKEGQNNFTTVLDVLDQEGLATVLAEPNLVALSGETASFLAGGEIPIPVPQGNGQVTIEFKEYGIKLSFVPTINSPKLINLRVRPEVSELDFENALKLTAGDFTTAEVPALKTRKAETSVEMGSGDSLAIAGLLSNVMSNQIKKIPGLADIPILGALFSSEQFKRNETELVIIVTPYIVNPTQPCALNIPMDGLKYATFLEMIFLHRLNREECFEYTVMDEECHLIGCAGFCLE